MTSTAPPLVRWITNIPTPYRNHRYRVAAEVFPDLGLAFEVWYMAWSERDRHWRFTDADLDHPHRVWPGAHPVVRGTDMHVNPSLLLAARRRPADVTIVAGWASFTTLALPWVLPHRRTLHLLESESNEASVVHQTGVFARARRRCVSAADGYVVPGPRARRLLEVIDEDAGTKPILELPNIVDESVFEAAVGRRDRELTALRDDRGLPAPGSDRRVWFCPARLEPFKGLDVLLPLLAGLPVTLVVAGTGTQQPELERLARAHALDVRFVGQAPEAEMVALYAASDLFVLPSRRDPNPLTPIEALAAGVPVLVSERAGNVDEVVAGDAGWRFDPERAEDMVPLLRRLATMSDADLAHHRESASRLHAARFASVPALQRFAEAVSTLVLHRDGTDGDGA